MVTVGLKEGEQNISLVMKPCCFYLYFYISVWVVEIEMAKFQHEHVILFEDCLSPSANVDVWALHNCIFDRRWLYPECVVLLGQVGENVGVEHNGLQEAAPQHCQLGTELAHIPADLLRHFLMAFLQLKVGTTKKIFLSFQAECVSLDFCMSFIWFLPTRLKIPQM